MMRPSQIPDGRPLSFRRAWYEAPLERLVETIGPMASGLRTLPDAQFHDELDRLATICAGADSSMAERAMFIIYQAEAARRADPAQQWDAELHLALDRLERATNDADRQFVTDIGRKLFDIGGRDAMTAAYLRMMMMARLARRDVRSKVLAKRWTGIDPQGGAGQ